MKATEVTPTVEIDPFVIEILEQALIAQALKADQQRVAGKGRETLVWGIAVSGRIQRQHLPHLLSGGDEKVREFVGAGAEISDAEGARKRSEVEQNSTTSRKFHSVTIRRSAASEQGVRKSEGVPSGGFPTLHVWHVSAVHSTWTSAQPPGSIMDRRPVNSRILRLSLHINLRVAMLCRAVLKLVQEEAVCH